MKNIVSATVSEAHSSDTESEALNTLRRAQRALTEGDLDQVEPLVDDLLQADEPLREAWRLWVQVALRQKQFNTAQERVERAIKARPKDPELHLMDARIQSGLGNKTQALQRITKARLRWPNHVGMQRFHIDLLCDLGKKREGLSLLRQLRLQGVSHASVMMGAARFYRSHARLRATKAVLDQLLKQHPKHANALQMRKEIILHEAQQALAAGDLDSAEVLVEHLMQADNPAPAAWRLWVQVAFRQGLLDSAMQRVEKALKAQPKLSPLHVLKARIQNTAGNPEQSLEGVNQALTQWPEHPVLKSIKFNLLNKLGRNRAALQMLRTFRKDLPQHPEVLMSAARFYHAHGRLYAARIALDYLNAQHPEYRPARILRQNIIMASARSANPAPAILIDSLRRIQHSPSPSSAELAELLHTLTLITATDLINTSLKSSCHDTVTSLSENIYLLTEHDKLTLLNQAERVGHTQAAHRALSVLFESGPRTPAVAMGLFRKAMASTPAQQADNVTTRLLKYVPKVYRPALAAEFALHLHGPQAALDCIRQDKRRQRSLPEARKLLKYLKLADPNRLALRYLRLCCRRWPNDNDLRLEYAELLMNAGYPQAALNTLNTFMPAAKQPQTSRVKALSLLDLGKVQTAWDEINKTRSTRNTGSLFELRLQILMMLGREKEAKELMQDAQRRSVRNQMTSGHFSTSFLGRHFNDLALFCREQASLPKTYDASCLVIRYFHPAVKVVQSHVQDEVARSEEPFCIPRQVIQYWDQRRPPTSVADIMRSWSSLPGINYKRFDSQKARSFIRNMFGAEYERAFRMVRNPAEGADFFRLCYLRHHGGIYADADDYLHGDLEALLTAGVGLVCYRGKHGALENNFIAAAPEHPAIVLASEMAAEAILARDHEGTWHMTGPGLLTRAVAHYLATSSPTALHERTAILPEYRLRQHVQVHTELQHKKTKQHWRVNNPISMNLSSYFTDKSIPELALF